MSQTLIKDLRTIGGLTRNYFFRPEKDFFVIKNVPFYPQWQVNPSKNDWRKFGAKNEKEYLLWEKNGCGMACLQMILAYKGTKITLIDLGKECLKYGGYTFDQDAFGRKDYESALPGLFYMPFIKFIRDEFNLHGKIPTSLSIPDIVKEIEKGNLVMASVHGSIRNPTSKPPKKGGHLILVFGFDWKKSLLYFHNPAGTNDKNLNDVKISFNDFNKFFDNKGLIINI